MMPRMQFSTMPGASSMPAAATPAGVSRRARTRAVVFDLLLCAGSQVAVGALALVVFMLQTGAGARDLTTASATTGWAVALAAVPAWFGLLGHSSALLDGTPGQRSAGLELEGTPTRRVLRLAVHPLSALGWLWLAVVAALATIPGVPLLLVAAAFSVVAAGAVSAVMLLRDPNTLPLHDRLTGTRLVAR